MFCFFSPESSISSIGRLNFNMLIYSVFNITFTSLAMRHHNNECLHQSKEGMWILKIKQSGLFFIVCFIVFYMATWNIAQYVQDTHCFKFMWSKKLLRKSMEYMSFGPASKPFHQTLIVLLSTQHDWKKKIESWRPAAIKYCCCWSDSFAKESVWMHHYQAQNTPTIQWHLLLRVNPNLPRKDSSPSSIMTFPHFPTIATQMRGCQDTHHRCQL